MAQNVTRYGIEMNTEDAVAFDLAWNQSFPYPTIAEAEGIALVLDVPDRHLKTVVRILCIQLSVKTAELDPAESWRRLLSANLGEQDWDNLVEIALAGSVYGFVRGRHGLPIEDEVVKGLGKNGALDA